MVQVTLLFTDISLKRYYFCKYMYQLYCYKGNYISICDQSVQMQMRHVKDMFLWLPKGYRFEKSDLFKWNHSNVEN